jgi:hypothetical protein
MYKDLSKSVHYGGMDTSLDNLCIDFSEYNRELFEKWYGNFNQVNEICNIHEFRQFLFSRQVKLEWTYIL